MLGSKCNRADWRYEKALLFLCATSVSFLMPFFTSPYLYYAIIGLQTLCVFHSIKKGNQTRWIWLIVFLPFVGSIAYIFTEILTKRDLQQVQSSVGAIINSGGRIKTLEERLRFADTFNNRVALADACLNAGEHDRAIELYESVLKGLFVDNEYVIIHLIAAYYEKQRYQDILAIAPRIRKSPDFARSRSRLLYALVLDKSGKADLAEKEFLTLNVRFAAYEARYEYELFLERNGRSGDAKEIFEELLNEATHLSSREKRDNKLWLSKVREELEKITV